MAESPFYAHLSLFAIVADTISSEALSTEQRSELVVIKGNIMWLLKTLRDNGLLSIGIHANVPAVASHLDFVQSHTENLSCSSKDVSSVTKPNESVLSLTKSLGGSTKTSLVPAPVTIKWLDDHFNFLSSRANCLLVTTKISFQKQFKTLYMRPGHFPQ